MCKVLSKKLKIENVYIYDTEGETKKLEDEGVFRADESWKAAAKAVRDSSICIVIGP